MPLVDYPVNEDRPPPFLTVTVGLGRGVVGVVPCYLPPWSFKGVALRLPMRLGRRPWQ